ncbi:MAG TPA: hypothetical protein VFX85_09225 [Solirubrobacterales bacterium]|nr:hypothetical protein [Solirubrobacterales bacterium]
MVSPPNKEGAEIPAAGPYRASVDGGRFTFLTEGAFGDAKSNATFNHFLAERDQASWGTRSLDPPLPPVDLGGAEAIFSMFDANLNHSILKSFDMPQLVADDPPGVVDLYRQDVDAGTYSLITTEPGQALGPAAHPRFAWASKDMDSVFFDSGTAGDRMIYFPGAPAYAAYYVRNGEMSLASIIPDESTVDPDDEVVAPAASAGSGVSSALGGRMRSVSEDGSRLIFTAASSNGFGLTTPQANAQLFVRSDHRTLGARTVEASAPEQGVSEPIRGAAWFQTASTDASKIFFTSCDRLTSDSTADAAGASAFGRCLPEDGSRADLYLYDLDAKGGDGDLIDLTAADPVNGADVRGVLTASEDGDRVYFVATGLLDADEIGGGEGAVAGEPSLYLWTKGQGVEHVARLGFEDERIWLDPINLLKDSRVSADGRYLAFASHHRRLGPAFDNAGHSAVYLYDAVEDDLVCASCADGGPASADATLGTQGVVPEPPSSSAFEKRNLAEDGSAVFFETAESIVPRDSNGKVDVYEFNTATGAIDLISSGRSASGSHFADATPDGSNAFFTTRERLVSTDLDGSVDIYAARVGGGYPEPPPSGGCGESCQEWIAPAPQVDRPGSAAFNGPGSIERKPARCSKGKRKVRHRGKVRCVRRHPSKAGKGGRS